MAGSGNSARWTAVLGGAALVTAVLLAAVPAKAPAPEGRAPVPGNALLSIELARNADEVMEALGRRDDEDPAARIRAADRRAALDHINRIDYAFMAAYSLYCGALTVFAAGYWRERRGWARWLAGLGVASACAMFAGDFVENEQLFRLTAAPDAGPMPAGAIGLLAFWTRVKWLALAASSLLLAALYVGGACRGGRRRLWALPAVFAAAGLWIAASVMLDAWRGVLGTGTALLGLAWLLGLIHAAGAAFRSTR